MKQNSELQKFKVSTQLSMLAEIRMSRVVLLMHQSTGVDCCL